MVAVCTPEYVWTSICRSLSELMSQSNMKIWIDPIQPLRLEGGILFLGCPNRFFMSWLKEHYYRLMLQALKQLPPCDGLPDRIELEVSLPRKVSKTNNAAPQAQYELPDLGIHRAAPLRFNRRFTFDHFVVGDTNQYAFSATQAMAMGQELNTDALYLLSEPGLGKSHLSQALGQHVLTKNAASRVYYLTAEDFTNELVYSIKNKNVDEFKNKYRKACDVLVLEEVQFLSGKEKVQAELCYTLDSLIENNKKVVFTAARLPKDIPRLGRHFSSRLSNSLISTISQPDYQTRLRILLKKAEDYGIKASGSVLEFLAEKIRKDVRQLESVLTGLGAKSKLMNMPITMDLAKDTLGDLVEVGSDITIDLIRKQVCRYYQVSEETLNSRSRKKNIVLPRNVGMYLARKLTDLSLENIGKEFGRNHSTVLYSVNVIENGQRRDFKLKNQVEFLTGQMMRESGLQ